MRDPALELYRDDGPLARAVGAALRPAWRKLTGGPAGAIYRLRWVVPPLLRFVEYSGLLWIGSADGQQSEAAAFALICVLAFRHYDIVYRLRHQGKAPPEWLANLALGWDGRLVLGYILLVAGALPAGFFIAAGLLATVFVAESIAGWRRFGRVPQPVTYEDEEDEGL